MDVCVCVCAHNFSAFIPRHSTDMSTALTKCPGLCRTLGIAHWPHAVPVLQATVQWGRQWETESYRYLLIYDCDMSSKGEVEGAVYNRKANFTEGFPEALVVLSTPD